MALTDDRTGLDTAKRGLPMTDASTGSTRLDQFEQEVADLRVKGGSAEPERKLMLLGILLAAIGVITGIVAYSMSTGVDDVRDQNELIILTGFGIALAIVGAVMFFRHSLTRWFRYWLVRLVYEDREQTDRVVAVLERIEARLDALERDRTT